MLGFETEPRCGRRSRGTRGAPPPGPKRIEHLIARVERHLHIGTEQRDAWERLTETIRDSAEAMRIACAAVERTEDRAFARYDRLADLADVVSATARRVRPALEGLYRTLDTTQRKALDELIAGRSPRSTHVWQ
ncbi:MAG: Spy/CpxP family protein refolding chaperone [Alphaproteobacteria bacterium]|nr:Spy/CpxP family protein refolding chaperone [Alphaproteobacteria bacterium]